MCNCQVEILTMDQYQSYGEWLRHSAQLFYAPSRFWNDCARNKPSYNSVFSAFLLPWLGFAMLLIVVGLRYNHPQAELIDYIRGAALVFISLLSAVWSISWSLNKIFPAIGLNAERDALFAVVAYPVPVLCIDAVLNSFFPESQILRLTLFFLVFLYFSGAIIVLKLNRIKAFSFALILSALFLGVSLAVVYLLQIVNRPPL